MLYQCNHELQSCVMGDEYWLETQLIPHLLDAISDIPEASLYLIQTILSTRQNVKETQLELDMEQL